MKALLCSILIVLLGFRAIAEEAPYKMHELLLAYNLAAHVKITSHGDNHFRVRVIDVLHRRKSGIIEGDYLKISHDFSVVCPPGVPIVYAEQKREALAFLSYHQGQWYLTQGEIAFLENENATVHFHEEGFKLKAPLAIWKRCLLEYIANFSRDEQNRLILKLDSSQLEDQQFTSLSKLQYRTYYRSNNMDLKKDKFLEPLELMEHVEEEPSYAKTKEAPQLHAAFMPISDSLMRAISSELNVIIHDKHPRLKEAAIAERCYYTLTFEQDGKVSDIDIIRPIDPTISEEIISYFRNRPNWKSALNDAGKPIRFKQTLVFPLTKK